MIHRIKGKGERTVKRLGTGTLQGSSNKLTDDLFGLMGTRPLQSSFKIQVLPRQKPIGPAVGQVGRTMLDSPAATSIERMGGWDGFPNHEQDAVAQRRKGSLVVKPKSEWI